jgi:hypothetical protein
MKNGKAKVRSRKPTMGTDANERDVVRSDHIPEEQPKLAVQFARQAKRETAAWIDPPADADLGYQTISDLLQTPPAVPGWIVDDMIPRGELSFFVSDGSIEKSWLLLTLAETLRCGGRSFLGQHVTPCNIVFVDMELSASWYVNRLQMVHTGLVRKKIIHEAQNQPHEIIYLERPTLRFDDASHFLDRVIPWVGVEGEIPDVSFFDYLKAVVEQTDAGVLIIDSISSLWGDTEENSANETTAVLDALKEVAQVTGAAVIIAHHTNKSRTEERGSTAIRNAAASMYKLNKDRDAPLDGVCILSCDKARHAPEAKPQALLFTWANQAFTVEQITKRELDALQANADV